MVRFICLTLLTLAACGKPAESPSQILLQKLALAADGTAEEAVELGIQALLLEDVFEEAASLVAQGERSASFDALEAALVIFDMALKKDPGNPRARAYLGFFLPFRTLKGFFWRMRPPVPSEKEDAQLLIQQLMSQKPGISNSAIMFASLPTSAPKFSDVSDLADYWKPQFLLDLKRARRHLRALYDQPGFDEVLYLPKVMAPEETVRMRIADIRLHESVLLGMEYFVRMQFLYRFRAPLGLQTQKDKASLRDFLKDPKVLTLMDPEFLKEIQTKGFAVSEGLMTLIETLRRRELTGENSARDLYQSRSVQFRTCARPIMTQGAQGSIHSWDAVESCHRAELYEINGVIGSTFFGSTIGSLNMTPVSGEIPFIQDTAFLNRVSVRDNRVNRAEELIAKLEVLKRGLTGAVTTSGNCPDGRDFSVVIDFPAFVRRQPKDLRDLGLYEFNGNFAGVKDETVRGLFPKGLPCDYVESSQKTLREQVTPVRSK